MPTKPSLRVVTHDEAAAPLSVAEAAATGDHRKLLVAMRERLAKSISKDDCPPRDLAALTRRLQDIAKEIEGIDLRLREEGLDGDDIPDEAWTSEAF